MKKIMLVEDEYHIRKIITEFFSLKGESSSALGMYKDGRIVKLQHQKERLNSLTQNPKNLYGQLSNIFNTSKDEINLFSELIQDKNKTKQNKNVLLKFIINKVLYENGNYSAITNENEKTFIDKYFSYRKTVTFSLNKSSDVNTNKGVINKSNLSKISMLSCGGNFTTSLVSNKERNKKVMGVKKNIKRK